MFSEHLYKIIMPKKQFIYNKRKYNEEYKEIGNHN